MVFTIIETQLKEAVEWSLSHFLVQNAIFLCERLNSENSYSIEDRESKLSLLARCYLAENSPHKAILVLKHTTSHENIYLQAYSYYQTGKYEEAEHALLKIHSSLTAEAFYLLGIICERQSRFEDAINNYTSALTLNPCLWTVFEKLCKLGFSLDPNEAFRNDSFRENHPPLGSLNIGKPSSPQKLKRSFRSMAELLSEAGKAHQALASYKVDEAIEAFERLPDCHRYSSWGYCELAKCYFEKYDFVHAIEAFERAFKESPHRTEDSDIYSSALWYEKKASDICYLLHNSLKIAYYAPQTWVIAGNFYALQKERETSIKCFNRAIQLDPFHSYAYSLCGHEHLANEDFEQAKLHYEGAHNIDPRQYTALWGLGSLYFKEEKFSQSLECYKAARNINPESSILLTYLGVNYKSLNEHEEAIECLEEAIRIDKRNPLPRFELGMLLTELGKDHEALAHFEILCEDNPRESHLYIEMGKLYARLGETDRALKCYNDAEELNPKSNTEIKNLIEELHGSSSFQVVPY